MNRSGRGLAAALAACAAALVAAPAAGAAVDMKISAPKGSNVLIEDVTLKAKCDEACTLGLNRVQAINFKGSQQLPVTSEEPLKGSKKLKPGQTATFNVPLGARIRSQIQSAAVAKEATVVQVVTDYNGVEGPYRSATLRVGSAPKAPVGQDDIVLAPKVKLSSGATRWRVSVKGVQTTEWRYNRTEGDPNGCHSWARGEGKQTIVFRSTKSKVARYGYGRFAKPKREPELVDAQGALVRWPSHMDITRTGKRDHGASPSCGGGGHCPDCGGGGGGGEPEQCTTKGTRDNFELSVALVRTRKLYAGGFGGNRAALALGQMPDCPIEAFKGSWGDVDLLDALHRFGNPAQHGGGRKVIVILRDKQTDKLDESGGVTTTSVRYTVTFTRI